ncbi:MAG: hypothetical protein AAFQ95_05180, partial [Cyanobacteria bacterium J06621_3]
AYDNAKGRTGGAIGDRHRKTHNQTHNLKGAKKAQIRDRQTILGHKTFSKASGILKLSKQL